MPAPFAAVLTLSLLFACARQPVGPSPDRHPAPEARGEPAAALDGRTWIIHHADDGAYWFGTDGAGIYRFDGTQLVRFTTPHGLGGDHIRRIQEDRAGNIYVSSDPGGVSRFDGRAFRTLTPLEPAASRWSLGPDDLWFAGGQDTGLVFRYDGTHLHQLRFPKTEPGEAHLANFPRDKFPAMKYNPYDVASICKDQRGHLWFGTFTLGACRYDGRSFA